MTTTPSVVTLAIAGVAGQLVSCSPASAPSNHARAPVDARVLRTLDGDTLDVGLDDGRRWRVRLLGIDAPEATTKTECHGREATRALVRLAARGERVTLTFDPRGERRDRYRRRLAYLRDRSGRLVQLDLLRAGHAAVFAYRDRRFVHRARFERAQAAARDAGRGGWRECGDGFPHVPGLRHGVLGR